MSGRRNRLALLAGLALAWALLTAGRLGWLAVVAGPALAARAERARVRVEVIRARRGRVLDRAGRVLAEDRPTYRVGVRLGELDAGPEISAQIARWVRVPRLDMLRRWDRLVAAARQAPGGAPLLLWRAPSATSARLFARLARRTPGLRAKAWDLFAGRALLLRPDRTLARLSELAGLDPERSARKVGAARARAVSATNRLTRRQRLDQPVGLRREVPFELAAAIREQGPWLPGVVVDSASVRRYPFGDVAGHVVGYLGPITKKEAATLRERDRLLNAHHGSKNGPRALAARAEGRFYDDLLGREGVERSYEDLLAGIPGVRMVERDRETGARRTVWEEPAAQGRDVRLTIDALLEEDIERALDQAVARTGANGGAAVLLDAQSGEVLALASSPRYDPGAVRARYRVLLADPRRPLVHRALAAAVPPGSTVKPLVATGVLTGGAPRQGAAPFSLETEVHCRGFLHTWGRFKCNGVHGDVRLDRALARSCNIYFYLAGEALGEAGLVRWLEVFALGHRPRVDLPGAAAGRVPTTAWRRGRRAAAQRAFARAERRQREVELARAGLALLPGPAAAASALGRAEAEARERATRQAARRLRAAKEQATWRKGDSRNTAIGQGDVLATPLQLAQAVSALATGLTPAWPRVATSAGAPAPIRRPLPVDPEVLRAVRHGMRRTVAGAWGTARRSKLAGAGQKGLTDEALDRFGRTAFAKTGTAQAPGGSHAWIVGWAPGPGGRTVAFSVLLEHTAERIHGGNGAGPVAAIALDRLWARLGEARP